MAFSDFDLNGSQTTALHSAAPLTTNPLTVGGVYCRSLQYNGTSQFSKIYYKTTAYGGAFYNVPNTKVLSLRSYVRTQGSSVFLTAKDSSVFASNTVNGYCFGIADGQYAFLQTGHNRSKVMFNAYPNSIPGGAWHSLRMDIFPLGPLGDRIICYKESTPGSGIWSNIIGGTTFDITLSPSDSKFVPWSNNGRCGLWREEGNSAEIFIDNINFSTYTAPA